MPSLDGGHYFLTMLTPIHADPCRRADGTVTSPTAAVREALAVLPTGPSPFARSDRTHFARFVVIDQPAFNGRSPADALADAVRKTDLLAHQPVDGFTRAWLLLAIDFDPGTDGLPGYLAHLWETIGAELRDVLGHCHDFTASVHDGPGFARYVARCQVETTMPFNDYWIDPPPLATLPAAAMAIGAVLLIGGAGIAGARAGLGWAVVAMLGAVIVALWLAYRFVLARGGRSFPAAPGSDLRTILKALHLQQHFARFAIERQGADPATLHAAFGAFLADLRPDDLDRATQAPGAVRS